MLCGGTDGTARLCNIDKFKVRPLPRTKKKKERVCVVRFQGSLVRETCFDLGVGSGLFRCR